MQYFIRVKAHTVDERDFPIPSHVHVWDMAGLEGDLHALVSALVSRSYY